jgi:hypothetical protein
LSRAAIQLLLRLLRQLIDTLKLPRPPATASMQAGQGAQ